MTLKRLLACELAVTKTKDSGHGNSGHRELQGLGLRVSGAGFMVWVSRLPFPHPAWALNLAASTLNVELSTI